MEAVSYQCKDFSGGIDLFFLLPYVKYSKSIFIQSGEGITTFPATVRYGIKGLEGTIASEDIDNGEHSQTLSFSVAGLRTTDFFKDLSNKDHRAIIRDRNGMYWMMGAINGLSSTVNKSTGASRGELNGYKVTMTGKEPLEMMQINDLSFFIEDGDASYILSSSSLPTSNGLKISKAIN